VEVDRDGEDGDPRPARCGPAVSVQSQSHASEK
jgi:hypothetical protein